MTTPKRKGGLGRNQGRKPLSEDSPTVMVSIKMTEAQRSAYLRNGGAAWVRNIIDGVSVGGLR